jgi:hypothetical protein
MRQVLTALRDVQTRLPRGEDDLAVRDLVEGAVDAWVADEGADVVSLLTQLTTIYNDATARLRGRMS